MTSFVNSTGKRRTEDYTLGGGSLFVAELDPATGLETDAGYRNVGNVVEFSTNINIEELLHRSTEFGIRVTDKRLVVQRDLNIAFQLDENSAQNLALFLQGSVSSEVNPAVAGFGPVQLSAAVELGRWYDIRNASGVRARDIEAANVTAEEVSGPTVLVLGTDYELDLKHGRIFLLSTAVNIAQGEALQVTLAADAGAAPSVDKVEAFTESAKQYVVKFIQNDGCGDEDREFQFHSVSLSPDGDAALIGEDFQTLGYTGLATAESVATGSPRTLTISDHVNT